jgi:hypothetical protein
MLHLALSALLALSGGTGEGADRDHAKNHQTATPEAVSAASNDDAILSDTYALGRSANLPIKVWVAYAFGKIDLQFSDQGDDVGLPGIEEIRSQRAIAGVQFNPLNLASFKFGLGAQATMANNTVKYNVSPALVEAQLQPQVAAGALTAQQAAGIAAATAVTGEFDSGFQLADLKFFGVLRGETLGIHGGYILDMGDTDQVGIEDRINEFVTSRTLVEPLPPVTERRDAIFFGADFDYPAQMWRLFGSVDYFRRFDDADTPAGTQDFSYDTMVFMAGTGVKVSWVELGAAFILSTDIWSNRMNEIYGVSAANPDTGGHQGSIVPYLRVSPPTFPATLYVKGAVLEEYGDYGYSMGGGNDLVTRLDVTAGLTLGF